MKHPAQKKGFSLVEVTAATVIFTMAIGMAVSGYMFTLKNATEGDTQGELDINVLIALESLKMDLRLSSLDEIHYYPEGPGPYQALSFPKAYDSDGDGLIERDDAGNIIWDETVIYHIRPTTPHELVKTTFNPCDITLTDAERQTQLEVTVATGSGLSAINGENSSSRALFANLLNWKILPQAGQYDAYSPSAEREHLSLGYSLLDGGAHDFAFKVTGKNASSSGYKVALDQFIMAWPNIEREAEGLTVSSQSGAIASSEYRSDGASGNYYLTFPATQSGDTFTLSVDIDRWVETNFRGGNQEEVILQDTTIEFDESLSPKDYTVALKGNDLTWEAELQTGSKPGNTQGNEITDWLIRTSLKGSEITDNGNWFAYNGRKCQLNFLAATNGAFKIAEAYIGESASSNSVSMSFNPSTITQVTFNDNGASASSGGTIVSDWIDLPIDKDKNYIVSYLVDGVGHPARWQDSRGSLAQTCMILDDGTGAANAPSPWSSTNTTMMSTIIGLSSIKVSYPEEGHYVSQIFDTGTASPIYTDINWNAELPAGTSLEFKVRTGDNENLSDALEWSAISSFNSPRAISAAFKRYVQFMAIMTSSSSGLDTPKLLDVDIDWEGPARMVNVGGIIAKGPDHGQLEITVDGNLLRSALIVDLEIYKDVYSMKGQSHRISSSMKVDVTPRNTSL